MRIFTFLWVVFFSFELLYSHEIRAPLLSIDGPLRCLLDPHMRDNNTLKVWTTFGVRNATDAFIKHGTSTAEMTNLIFGASDFHLVQAFPDCYVPQATEYYNPLLRTTIMHTAASYSERHFIVGLKWTYPVYQDRGWIGVRMSIPFQQITMMRTDQSGVRGGADLQDVLAIEPALNPAFADSSQAALALAKQSIMMRLDFAEALVQSNHYNPAVQFSTPTQTVGTSSAALANTGNVTVGGNAVAVDANPINNKNLKRLVFVVKSDEGYIPRVPDVFANVGIADPKTGVIPYPALPADGSAVKGKVYSFDDTVDYTQLSASNGSDVDTRLATQLQKAQLWLIPCMEKGGQTIVGVEDGSSLKILKDLSAQVTQNAFEWLYDRGYNLASTWATGIGDADLEFFYQQEIDEQLTLEGLIGLVLPFIKENDFEYFSNPYQAYIGNSGHWEVRIGGNAGWKFNRYFTLKTSGAYNFVLSATEKRCAAFQGARVKNIGPMVEADVHWQYARFRADVTAFHPESYSLSGLLGYEFYWKGKDAITFRQSAVQSWLGQTGTLSSNGVMNFSQVVSELDSQLLAFMTDSMSHRLHFEVALRPTDYCELYGGCDYTIAGKNALREIGYHFGVHITF